MSAYAPPAWIELAVAFVFAWEIMFACATLAWLPEAGAVEARAPAAMRRLRITSHAFLRAAILGGVLVAM